VELIQEKNSDRIDNSIYVCEQKEVKEQDEVDKKAAGIAEETDAKYVFVTGTAYSNIKRQFYCFLGIYNT